MKNTVIKLFILIFLVSFVTKSNAQEGFWYGVSLGAQNTYLVSPKISSIDAKNALRPYTMIDIECRFFPKFAIQSGVGYSLLTQNTSKFKNNFNYLTIPLYFKWGGFKADRKWSNSYFVGMNLNFILSAQNKYQGEKNDITSYTNKLLKDIVIGYGVKYKYSDHFLLECHLTGSYGSSIELGSSNGSKLIHINYGGMISIKYQLTKK
jgi:hypothetical protein